MDKSIAPPIRRETRFRSPHRAERSIGLWVDRIGACSAATPWNQTLRLLGQYAVVVIDSGQGQLYNANRTSQPLQPLDVSVHTPRVPIAYAPSPTWYTRWIVWNGPEADSLLQLGYLDADIPIVRGAGRAVNQAYFALVQLVERDDLSATLARKTILNTMILELYEARRLQSGSLDAGALAAQAVQYIRRHYMLELNIEALASDFGLSTSHFRRLFRSYTGCSPKQFLTSVRLSRAKELLAAGATIKQVGAAVGYTDCFYFMRIFKAEVGMPAGQFAAAAKL